MAGGGDTILTLIQALQLTALLPCLFLTCLLLHVTRPLKLAMIPVGFFIVLSASFLSGPLSAAGLLNERTQMVLMWLESTQPSFMFLLIIQLWRRRIPHRAGWLILALPVIGGSSAIYATFMLDEVCLSGRVCVYAEQYRILYHLFASSAIFLLLVAHISHVPVSGNRSRYESHRYWVMIALILLGVLLIGNDFLLLKRQVSLWQHDLIGIVMRISFIYLVTTSLFRLFDSRSERRDQKTGQEEADAAQLETLMREEKLWREMGLNRDALAQRLKIPEKRLSRTINLMFRKNFNEYVNQFRVEEAKQRLSDEETAVTVIAFEVGFSSIASFNRVFKGLTGMSPSAYRSRMRGD